AAARSRSRQPTHAPSSAKRRATARPIPLPAPVTRATRPTNRLPMAILKLLRNGRSAIDRQHDPGDKVRFHRREKADGAGDLFRAAHTTHGLSGSRIGFCFLWVGAAIDPGTKQRRVDETWAY